MAEVRRVHEELAIHHTHNITEAVKPAELLMALGERRNFFAVQALRLVDVGQRQDALDQINQVIRNEIVACPVTGVRVSNLGDINRLDGLFLGVADGTKANKLRHLRDDAVDGIAVATVVRLSEESSLNVVITRGDAVGVEQLLGISDESQGFGRIVVDNAILDKSLRVKLRSMQTKAQAGALTLDVLADTSKDIEVIMERGYETKSEEEALRVLSYIGSLMGDLEEVRLAGEERRDAYFDAQEVYAKKQLHLSQEAEATTFNAWYAGVISKAGPTGLPGQAWAFDAKRYFRGTGAEWNDYLDTVTGWSNRVMTRRAMLASGGDVGKKYYDASYPKIQERSFALTYNDERTGLRRALETVSKDLYVETITEVGGLVREITAGEIASDKQGQFVMRYEVFKRDRGGLVPTDNSEGADIMASQSDGGRRAYLLRLADLLIRNQTAQDVEHATLMASMALDYLELGYAMDGPDHKRKCNHATEAARTNSRPGFKFGAKGQGGEVFAGTWMAYFQERYADEIKAGIELERRRVGVGWTSEMEGEVENKIVTKMARDAGLIPEVLCGSVLDTKVATEQGEMILGRALQARIKLTPNPESDQDMLFKTNKWFENATDFWALVSGEKKLDFKGGIREADSVLTEFGKAVNNPYADLRSRGMVNIDNLIGAIGGAAGLVPSDPMILNIPIDSVHGKTYSFLIEGLLNHMPALSPTETEILRQKLNVREKLADKLLKWWEFSKDGKLKPNEREEWRRHILHNEQGLFENNYRKLASM